MSKERLIMALVCAAFVAFTGCGDEPTSVPALEERAVKRAAVLLAKSAPYEWAAYEASRKALIKTAPDEWAVYIEAAHLKAAAQRRYDSAARAAEVAAAASRKWLAWKAQDDERAAMIAYARLNATTRGEFEAAESLAREAEKRAKIAGQAKTQAEAYQKARKAREEEEASAQRAYDAAAQVVESAAAVEWAAYLTATTALKAAEPEKWTAYTSTEVAAYQMAKARAALSSSAPEEYATYQAEWAKLEAAYLAAQAALSATAPEEYAAYQAAKAEKKAKSVAFLAALNATELAQAAFSAALNAGNAAEAAYLAARAALIKAAPDEYAAYEKAALVKTAANWRALKQKVTDETRVALVTGARISENEKTTEAARAALEAAAPEEWAAYNALESKLIQAAYVW